jgi:hypothetical protein
MQPSLKLQLLVLRLGFAVLHLGLTALPKSQNAMMPPSKRSGWIKWRDSMPKHIIMCDLQTGILPIDAVEMLAEEARVTCYQNMAEFICTGVVFDQFKKRLQDHRKQVGDQTAHATQEEEALLHDRGIFPLQTKNHCGDPVFAVYNPKMLLRGDVADGKYLTMKPALLQQSHREYQPFEP